MYPRLRDGIEAVLSTIEDLGLFVGIVGFSQGGAMAGMVASLLERNRSLLLTSRLKAGCHILTHPPH